MANYPQPSHAWQSQEPLVLIVPDTDDVGPGHWQSLWESKRSNCRVELGMWDAPHRNTWVSKLNLAIRRADRPVVLVAHGLGCLAAAWWADYERPGFGSPVLGALLVAPPDVNHPGRDPRLARFGSCPRQPLPFPSFLVVSHDDPFGSYRSARALARDWGSRFADAGAVGHIDAGSGLEDWPFGEKLLEQLLSEHRRSIAAQALSIAVPVPAH